MAPKTPYADLYKWDKTDTKLVTIQGVADNAEKLDTKLSGHNERITAVEGRVTTVEGKVTTVDKRVDDVNTDITTKVKPDIASVKNQLDSIILASGTSDAETVQARGTFPILKDRLNSVDTQLADISSQTYITEKAKTTDVNNALALKADKTEVNSLATGKADKTYVEANYTTLDTKINSQASGSPKGVYATLSALQAAFPTGNSNIYLVTGNVKEVASLTVTAVPTVAGNVTVTLNGVATNIAVDPAIETTTALVATKIRNTVFPTGAVTGGTGSTVTFTASAAGVKTDATYSAGTTGTTGTMTTTTQGADPDGKWYYWSGSVWAAGGVYQSTGLPDNAMVWETPSIVQGAVVGTAPSVLGRTRFNEDAVKNQGYLQSVSTYVGTAGTLKIKIFSKNTNDTFNVENEFDVTCVLGANTFKSGIHFPDDIELQKGWYVGFYDLNSLVNYRSNASMTNKTFVGNAIGDNITFLNGSGAEQAIGYEVSNPLSYITSFTKRIESAENYESNAKVIQGSETTAGRTRVNEDAAQYTGYLQTISTYQTSGGTLTIKLLSKNIDETFNVEKEFDVTVKSGLTVLTAGTDFPTNLVIEKGWYVGFYSGTVPVHYYSGTQIPNFSFVGNAIGNTNTFVKSSALTISFGYSLVGSISIIPNLQKQIEMLTNDVKDFEINLPQKIYALVGNELNIYFDNIMSERATDFEFDTTCSIGNHYEKRYTVVPATAGNYSITITATKNGTTKTATATIIVTASTTGNGITKNVLVIGDSTTDNNFFIPKLQENFSSDVMNINTIGTMGNVPNKHEGHSGWSASTFVTTGSPFYINSVVDFSAYITNNSLAIPDYVILNLGINDLFSATTDSDVTSIISSMFTSYNTLIASIKTQNANVKIGVALTIPPNYSQDAFGVKYGSGQTRLRYKKNNFMLVKKLIETFGNREVENIYLVPIYTNLDTQDNFPTVQKQVNARNTKMIGFPADSYESVTGQSAGVHPAESGYWQIADVYWYFLKSFES